MSLFSQRKNIRPFLKEIQKESIDNDLRNKLWSAIKITIWDKLKDIRRYDYDPRKDIKLLIDRLWLHYFKQPIDTVPNVIIDDSEYSAYGIIREYFFKSQWWEIYDLLEFIIDNIPDSWEESYKIMINNFLEQENAGYRFVDYQIVDVIDENEINSVETAIEKSQNEVKMHLRQSLSLLSDKKNPDYRNSIKESISAVESLCKYITQNKNATLGDCIKILKKNAIMHPAFEQALDKLYGYTSDANGIRHSLIEGATNISYSDAKFMLVSCSAFVNYLMLKIVEYKIKI